MKKLLTICLLAVALTSCHTKTYNADGVVSSDELVFTVMKIGNCQYLYRRLDRGCMFTHSGECNNPIHIPVKICGDTITYQTVNPVKHTK